MSEQSNLLFDEQPLIILPQLAQAVGLNEAIILQQVHYWLKINEKAERNLHDGYYWTFNSYRQWREQFPFWSLATLRRAIASLEKQGLLISGEYNKMAGDRSKWYRIDYSRLGVSTPSAQNEHMGLVKMSTPSAQNEPTNTRDYHRDYLTEIIESEVEESLKHILTILAGLPGWKPRKLSEDLGWLVELQRDFPELTEQDIRACRDHWDGKATRHKGQWKTRIRNWARKGQEINASRPKRDNGDRNKYVSGRYGHVVKRRLPDEVGADG